jgi:hypothetical protein
MKYRYRIEKFIYHDGDEEPMIVMEDDKYRLVAQFLMSDVQTPISRYECNALDKVLSGKSEYEEINGNVCGLEIRRDKTTIYDNLAEDCKGDWCEIETQALRELIDIWFAELKRFEKHRQKSK